MPGFNAIRIQHVSVPIRKYIATGVVISGMQFSFPYGCTASVDQVNLFDEDANHSSLRP